MLKNIMIENGTCASLVTLTLNNATTIIKKPNAEENSNRCATNFGLLWHVNIITPMKAHPAPMFFRKAIATFMALSLSKIFGNINLEKNSG